MELSEPDARLLRALQQNGRMSNQDLAEATRMSTSACWRRVKALEEAGVIRRYSVVLDATACGLDFQALTQVVLSRHEPDHVKAFTAAIKDREEIIDCFATTGEADYYLRVCCRDKDAYNRLLEEFLFRLPGVANIKTNLVLKEVKHGAALPVT